MSAEGLQVRHAPLLAGASDRREGPVALAAMERSSDGGIGQREGGLSSGWKEMERERGRVPL